MTSFEFGDVVLVVVPYTDGSSSKQRPALVVSSALFHSENANRIILPISSQVRPGRETEAAIGNWKRAGLLGPSVVKPALATLEQGLISRKLGHLADPDLAAVCELLRKILVLER